LKRIKKVLLFGIRVKNKQGVGSKTIKNDKRRLKIVEEGWGR
jgi:hypothetical protein